jgi:peptide/nickel transport system substrate-binding protein
MRTKWFSTKLSLLFLALFLIASLLVIGCSSKTTTLPATTTSAPAATTTTKPVATTTTAPAATTTTKPAITTTTATTPAIKKGGTLKIILGVTPNAFGFAPDIVRSDDIFAASPCLETLYRIDSSGMSVPWLAASSIKYDIAALTATMTLRQGIKFQDGTDFNAEAVKWNLDQQIPLNRVELKNIKSIDAVDASTIRFNLSAFDNTIEFNLAQFVGVISSPTYYKSAGRDVAKYHPVGTGPFKFVSWQRDVNLKYTRFDGYWQAGKPYLDNVEFDYVADPMVRLASFKAGEGDVLLSLDPKDAQTLEGTGKYTTSKCLSGMQGLAGDGSHATSPFANLKVRQAIEYALNREPVCKAVGLGYYEATDQSCAKSNWGYNPTPSPYTYDPAKAKALLAEAGYPNGLGGLPLTVANSPASSVDFYTAILEQLNNAGFGLKLDVVDPAKFGQLVIQTGWTNTLLGWGYTEFADSSSILINGWSSFGFPYRSIYHPQELDDTIKAITQTTDFESKKALVQKANGLIRDKYCTLAVLYREPGISARVKAVHNDGLFSTVTWQGTLEDCWLDR